MGHMYKALLLSSVGGRERMVACEASGILLPTKCN